jgi:hypothetical protein
VIFLKKQTNTGVKINTEMKGKTNNPNGRPKGVLNKLSADYRGG